MANTIPDDPIADELAPDLQRDTIPGPPPQECANGDDMSWGEEPQPAPRPSGTYTADLDAVPQTLREGDPVHIPALRVPRIGSC